jgi:hypothetical protein
MIRQARRYLVGAASSVTVISIAIVAFVLLVSAQVFQSWPIGDLGSGDGQAAVSSADAVGSDTAPGAPKTVAPGGAGATAPEAGGGERPGGGDRTAAPQDDTGVGSNAPPVTSSEPVAPAEAGNGPSSGSDPSESPAPAESNSSPSSGGGSATSAATGSSGGGGSKSGSSGSGSGPGKVAEEVAEPVTGGSTSAKVTETVNETVNSVDETATGGALKEAGVTGLTEEVVNGAAGPESVVGKTVDEAGKAVGGLLGQH